jgi:hypothetical protein
MAMDPASTSGGGTSSSIISEGAMNESGFWSAIRAQHSTMNRYKFLLYGLGIGLGVGLTGVGVYYFVSLLFIIAHLKTPNHKISS